MTTRLSLAVLPVLAAALLPALAAQQPAAKSRPEAEPLRVHVIGASVSGGFEDGPLFGADEQGDSVTLQYLLKRWAGGDARVTTHNTMEMLGMFRDPLGIGERQIGGALKAKPDVVVAVDFPFWFGYGYVGGEEREGRQLRLGFGLELLARLEVPVVLGDLPDMRGAARRMLSPQQIPAPALLAELNGEIAKFVAAHPNFRPVGLSTVVREMREVGVALPLADGAVKTPKLALQQADRLHATRLGMAYLGYVLQPALCRACPEDHPLRARRWTFEQFVAAAGAEGELEELLERVAGAAAAGAGGAGRPGR